MRDYSFRMNFILAAGPVYTAKRRHKGGVVLGDVICERIIEFY